MNTPSHNARDAETDASLFAAGALDPAETLEYVTRLAQRERELVEANEQVLPVVIVLARSADAVSPPRRVRIELRQFTLGDEKV